MKFPTPCSGPSRPFFSIRSVPSFTSRAIIVPGLLLLGALNAPLHAATQARSTEDFLNLLGVNTHLDGNGGWNTNATQVGQQMAYLGVRLERDWPTSTTSSGSAFHTAQLQNPLGRLWTSIAEDSPTGQRTDLTYCENVYSAYGSGLVYVMGGPNEEDDSYPQGLNARLPDSADVQTSLWGFANPVGVKVSQMEFGAGWTSQNSYQGDYNPSNPGVNYTESYGDQSYQSKNPGSHADFGGAHTYIIDTTTKPTTVLGKLRALALLTTPGKPVAHTEMGVRKVSGMSTTVFGQYMVMGAFDSASAGDVGYIVYGMQDNSDTYGFYTSAGVANPVATYYHNLTTLLSCANTGLQYAPGQAASFTPGTLNVSYSNTSTVSHYLLQKPTGEFVIAAYSEQLMNGGQAAVSDTINFGQTFASAQVYDVQTGTTSITTLTNASSYTLTLNPSDTYLIVLSNATQTIVKDNGDPTGIAIAGSWQSSTGATGYYGSNYIYTGIGSGATVTFTPTIGTAGTYDVYARWTTNANRATNTRYTINYAGGSSNVNVNQQTNNGTWVLLGSYSFNAGTTGNVVVSNNGANGIVVADAVEFVLH